MYLRYLLIQSTRDEVFLALEMNLCLSSSLTSGRCATGVSVWACIQPYGTEHTLAGSFCNVLDTKSLNVLEKLPSKDGGGFYPKLHESKSHPLC